MANLKPFQFVQGLILGLNSHNKRLARRKITSITIVSLSITLTKDERKNSWENCKGLEFDYGPAWIYFGQMMSILVTEYCDGPLKVY